MIIACPYNRIVQVAKLKVCLSVSLCGRLSSHSEYYTIRYDTIEEINETVRPAVWCAAKLATKKTAPIVNKFRTSEFIKKQTFFELLADTL